MADTDNSQLSGELVVVCLLHLLAGQFVRIVRDSDCEVEIESAKNVEVFQHLSWASTSTVKVCFYVLGATKRKVPHPVPWSALGT
jgi:hypothetical protein